MRFSPSGKLLISVLFSLCFSLTVHANSMRASLFSEAEEAVAAANKNQANVLAPESYAKAKRFYEKAEDRLQRNQSIDRIKKDLEQAVIYFNKSAEAAELAALPFQSIMKARSDALAAEANKRTPELWADAESSFADAATTLENGNLKRAQRKAEAAEKIYREAELNAIKNAYLAEARSLIQQARKKKVNRYAPKTLYKAKTLLEKAEKELTENRYDTDYARSLAREARYEARHAIYLAQKVEELEDSEQTYEEFLLTAEEPLRQIASLLEDVAEFDTGLTAPTDKIKARIEALQRDSYELGERRTEIGYLEKEIALLEKRLGVQSERLALQEAQRDKLRRATEIFESSEAIVLTQGSNFLIRPIGLTFAPGSAQIDTRNFLLLKKLQKAISIYKDYHVVVEGHTDSFGSDSTNLALSLERAKAVRTYLLANMNNLSPGSIEAIGYGETKPIANNETAEGRERNRRIDFVLRPK